MADLSATSPAGRFVLTEDGVWDGSVVRISDDRAVLAPSAAHLVVQLIDRYSRTEKVPLSRSVRNIRDTLARVAAAERGTAEHPGDHPAPGSAHDEIGIPQAAQLLHCSREYAGRLARDGRLGPTRKHGNRRYVQRSQVDEYLIDHSDTT